MNSRSDKELDLLLNRLARRKAAGPRGQHMTGGLDGSSIEDDGATVETGFGPHLDADELNAYAENALLPAARARYSVHLADCETCRQTVTNLALAANVAGELEKSAATQEHKATGKSWWQNLAALFTLPIVRYGVPALVLLAVISTVFINTRRQSQPESVFVAQNRDRASTSAVRPDAEENHSQPSPNAAPALATEVDPAQETTVASKSQNSSAPVEQAKTAPTEKSESLSPKKDAGQASTDNSIATRPAPIAGPPVSLSQPNDAPAQAEKARRAETDKESAGSNADVAANEPPPTPPKSPDTDKLEERKDSTGGAQANQQQARDERESRFMIDGQNSKSGEDSSLSKNKTSTMSKVAPAASVARKRAGGRESTESGTARGSISTEESTGEKLSIGGRTFRRQGNAWVDTAYNSSRPTVNIQRGSEQYRALTGDEPSLRAIAEQLGGEVLVVWKGRAYRIH